MLLQLRLQREMHTQIDYQPIVFAIHLSLTAFNTHLTAKVWQGHEPPVDDSCYLDNLPLLALLSSWLFSSSP
jgi:hypothetical protein